MTTAPRRLTPFVSLGLAVAVLTTLLVAALLATSTSQAGAAVGDCTVTRNGSDNVISWEPSGRTDVIRRDDSWLSTPPRGSAEFTDANAPEGAAYLIRTRSGPDNVITDFTCAGDEQTAPQSCTLVRTGAGNNRLSWEDNGGTHIIRVNGSWLATLGSNVSHFIDVDGPVDAVYELRTHFPESRSRVACEPVVAPEPVVEPPVVVPAPVVVPPAATERQFVVHVSVDGLRSDFLTDEITPNLAELAAGGASTLNARTDTINTQTLPNHTSQFTGRFVGTADTHGANVNEDPGGTLHDRTGEYVSSVFDVVHDNGGRTVFYSGKEKFDLLDRTWSIGGGPDATGPNDGTNKLDVSVRGNPLDNVQAFVDDLTAGEGPTFGFYHIREPDSAGHTYTFASPGYQAGVTSADQTLGQLRDALDAAGVLDQVTFIVTSDHGGPTGADLHNAPENLNTYTVPFVVSGNGVGAGTDLYELNPTSRIDPGSRQIGETGPQPIRGHDAANLALDLFGLPAIPGSVVNQAQDLEFN